MSAALVITVRSLPAPQGSKRHVGKGVMIESSKQVKPWRDAVRLAAIEEMGDAWTMLDEPVELRVTFYFTRPKAHYRTGKNAHLLRDAAPAYPHGKPDCSKLVRSTEDALTEAGVWRDDARITTIVAGKRYGTYPGAIISVQPEKDIRIEVPWTT